jgi:hypothetical protein
MAATKLSQTVTSLILPLPFCFGLLWRCCPISPPAISSPTGRGLVQGSPFVRLRRGHARSYPVLSVVRRKRRATAGITRLHRPHAMQENAGECVALRGKLFQVGFFVLHVRFFSEHFGETLISSLVHLVWVPSLPPLKLCPSFVAHRFPNVGSGDPFPCL